MSNSTANSAAEVQTPSNWPKPEMPWEVQYDIGNGWVYFRVAHSAQEARLLVMDCKPLNREAKWRFMPFYLPSGDPRADIWERIDGRWVKTS